MHRNIAFDIYAKHKDKAEALRMDKKLDRQNRLEIKTKRYLKKVYKWIDREARRGFFSYDFYTNVFWFPGEFVDSEIAESIVDALRSKGYLAASRYSEVMKSYNISVNWRGY